MLQIWIKDEKNKTKNIQWFDLFSNFVFFYIYIRIILRNQNKPEIFKLSSKLCILAFFVHLFTAYTPNCLVRKSREDQKVKKRENKQNPKQTFLRYQWLYCVQVVNYVCRYETMKTKKMKLYDENQYIQKNLAVNHIVLVNWWTEKQNMWEKYNKNGIIYWLFCEHELFQLDCLGKTKSL